MASSSASQASQSTIRMPSRVSAGANDLLELARVAARQLLNPVRDAVDRLGGGEPVGPAGVDPGVHLVVHAGDPHHVELVQVGGVDGEELDPLEQGRRLVLRKRQNPLVEVEPGQLAVHEELGGVELGRLRAG